MLIVAAVFGAGIWKKKQTASPHLKKSENSVSMDQQEDGITYKGKTYTYNDHLSNFLFMGIDTRGEVENQETDNTGQADAIFLVSMDRVTEQIHVISIPRDTITENRSIYCWRKKSWQNGKPYQSPVCPGRWKKRKL